MANLFGALGLGDTDRVFNATVGQEVIYEAAAAHIAARNAELNALASVFISGETEAHKMRYKLPGSGKLQRRGLQANAGAVKAYGEWDVAFPLEDFAAQIAGDDVSMAYMTAAELSRHIDTVTVQNTNTVRFEMLKALFNSTAATFADPLWGSLTIQRLANGDSVTYPPVLGSESDATEDHYLESGYLASAISDTNDPYVTIVDELEEHFGSTTGGGNIAVFVNNAQRAKTTALTDFVEVPDSFVIPGVNTATPSGLPAIPGRILGRHNAGCWIIEWRWIPSGYMFGVHMDEEAPLMKRVDPADTGLPRDLALVAQDTQSPFESSKWRHRFGLGVGNRLNGVAMELADGGTYTVPTAYA